MASRSRLDIPSSPNHASCSSISITHPQVLPFHSHELTGSVPKLELSCATAHRSSALLSTCPSQEVNGFQLVKDELGIFTMLGQYIVLVRFANLTELCSDRSSKPDVIITGCPPLMTSLYTLVALSMSSCFQPSVTLVPSVPRMAEIEECLVDCPPVDDVPLAHADDGFLEEDLAIVLVPIEYCMDCEGL